MKNWLGQDIEVGSVVYRGARSGNTSEYKVGVVSKVNEDKGKVTVDWILEKRYSTGKPWAKSGTSGVDTLVLIDLTLEDVLMKCEELLREANRERQKMNIERGSNLTPLDRWW